MSTPVLGVSSKWRLNWIDWMKSIGMFLIVWGHFMPEYFINFIYAFNVPVFFLISGYLFKPRGSLNSFLVKTMKTLVIPTILFLSVQSTINICILRWYNWGGVVTAFLGNGYYLGGLWFVYTLLILKSIFNMLHSFTTVLLCLVLGCIIINIWMQINGLEIQNSWYNTLTAIPFFYIGYLCKFRWQDRCNIIIKNISNLDINIKMFFLIILIYITYVIGELNGPVWMYLGQYGANYILFLIGAFTGSGVIFIISVMLIDIYHTWTLLISQGTIVILGLHYNAIVLSSIVYPRLGLNQHNPLLSFITALIVMVSFIPLIKLISRYFPIAIGRKLVS